MRYIRSLVVSPIVLFFFASSSRVAMGDFTFTTIASFASGINNPDPSGLTIDSRGNLYGTTVHGGSNGYGSLSGSVFEVAAGSNTISTIASFNGSTAGNSYAPVGGVAIDSQGNLYATASGGANYVGSVVEIAAGTGVVSLVASFNGDMSVSPNGVTVDSQGNLYGTTNRGGPGGLGTVFEVAAGSGTVSTLVQFNGATNGQYPFSGLTMDAQGNLYGTTFEGGPGGAGTVFKIAAGTGAFSTVATFGTTGNSPGYPEGPLLVDSHGNIFGTTVGGAGGAGLGTVFEIAAGTGVISTIVDFPGGSAGAVPRNGLVMDAQGNLYGTTSGYDNNPGTVFEIAAGTDILSTLATFNGTNGYDPSGLTIDSQGNLFGTTSAGGADGAGTIFELVNNPPVVPEPASIVALGQAIAAIGIGLAFRARSRRAVETVRAYYRAGEPS